MILQHLFKKENIERKKAKSIYNNILKESNNFIINNDFFIKKDFKASFEIISLLLILYINMNLNTNIKKNKKINEELISIFISDLDESLRSKGIGDMSLGKYVKSYVKKFYFRLKKFSKILDNINNDFISDYLVLADIIKEGKLSKASEKFTNLINSIVVPYK